jgi:hypothetical protein
MNAFLRAVPYRTRVYIRPHSYLASYMQPTDLHPAQPNSKLKRLLRNTKRKGLGGLVSSVLPSPYSSWLGHLGRKSPKPTTTAPQHIPPMSKPQPLGLFRQFCVSLVAGELLFHFHALRNGEDDYPLIVLLNKEHAMVHFPDLARIQAYINS